MLWTRNAECRKFFFFPPKYLIFVNILLHFMTEIPFFLTVWEDFFVPVPLL
jgi:hypothetical protein